MSHTQRAEVAVASERTPLKARKVAFEWSDTPLHWIPGDPFTTHTINVLHLLLPAGERWFVHVYKLGSSPVFEPLQHHRKGWRVVEGLRFVHLLVAP
jgi:predicted metal-dependent hydrolase